MIKTGDSLRSVGLTYIPVDKPTRAALKAIAGREGLPLSHYLREVARRELENMQIPLAGLPISSSGSVAIASIKNDIASILSLMHQTWNKPTDELISIVQKGLGIVPQEDPLRNTKALLKQLVAAIDKLDEPMQSPAFNDDNRRVEA